MQVKTISLCLIKHIYTIVIIVFLFVLTACSTTDDVNTSDALQTQVEPIVPEESQSSVHEPPSFHDYQSYIDYISDIPTFEPYYKTVFAFEEFSDGVASVPIEKVKAMYNEMKKVFDYVVVSEYPLFYRGYYDGETSFVDGYEKYEAADIGAEVSNPINIIGKDFEGDEIVMTPLKTILLGESVLDRFDKSIEEGRNLLISDFTLTTPNDPISVVLGNAYKDSYEIGDMLSLELISEVMDFQVVGFYKPGVVFSMEVGALQHMNIDHTIVMPHFIPAYEPVGEAAVFQHAFHVAELTSGYISIPESVEKINDDTYNHTMIIMEEMAKRNGLEDLYKMPYWPVGFIWQDGEGD